MGYEILMIWLGRGLFGFWLFWGVLVVDCYEGVEWCVPGDSESGQPTTSYTSTQPASPVR